VNNQHGRKVVMVSRFLLQNLFITEGDVIHAKCTQGLPSDAVFIGLTYDHQRDCYYCCFESASWEAVDPGCLLPELRLTFTNIYVTPLLERAERLIAASYDSESTRWIEEYRALKKDVGWSE